MLSVNSAGRRRRRQGRAEMNSVDPLVVDVEQEFQGVNMCIDLTQDDDLSVEEIVDLTRPGLDSPIVVLDTLTVSPRFRRRQRQTRNSRNNDSTEVVDVDLPPFTLEGTPLREEGTRSARDMVSPEGRKIACPICLDGYTQIHASGRRLNSTTCGHVFCEMCIKTAIQSQGNCPTCRKRLTLRQIHPLFV